VGGQKLRTRPEKTPTDTRKKSGSQKGGVALGENSTETRGEGGKGETQCETKIKLCLGRG